MSSPPLLPPFASTIPRCFPTTTTQRSTSELTTAPMSSIVLPDASVAARPTVRSNDRHGWGYVALLLAVGMLFLRPSDLLASVDDLPIYQTLMAVCLVLGAKPISGRLTHRDLSRQPVTACVLVLLIAVVASHLVHGFVWGARMSGWMAVKLIALYLAIVGLVDSPRRLITFISWLVLGITLMASLALLNEWGVISLASLESLRGLASVGEGEFKTVNRIRGTGIFHDPNDLGLVVVPGFVLSVYLFGRPGLGWPRYGWLVVAALLTIALVATHSRGAFVALAAVVPVFLFDRYGWKATVAGSLAALPPLAFLFAGRMTEIDAIHQGTGQSRLQIWSDHLTVFRRAPLFGIGEGMLVEEFGVVSHNSFMHCFAELGAIGGVAFVSAFLAATFGLARRARSDAEDHGPTPTGTEVGAGRGRELGRLRGYVFTAVVAYSVGLMSLSRQFVAPTYLMLGLAVATHGVARVGWPPGWENGFRFLFRGILASVTFLTLVYVAVLLFARR